MAELNILIELVVGYRLCEINGDLQWLKDVVWDRRETGFDGMR
jgi:hypothetical protein